MVVIKTKFVCVAQIDGLLAFLGGVLNYYFKIESDSKPRNSTSWEGVGKDVSYLGVKQTQVISSNYVFTFRE